MTHDWVLGSEPFGEFEYRFDSLALPRMYKMLADRTWPFGHVTRDSGSSERIELQIPILCKVWASVGSSGYIRVFLGRATGPAFGTTSWSMYLGPEMPELTRKNPTSLQMFALIPSAIRFVRATALTSCSVIRTASSFRYSGLLGPNRTAILCVHHFCQEYTNLG